MQNAYEGKVFTDSLYKIFKKFSRTLPSKRRETIKDFILFMHGHYPMQLNESFKNGIF